MQRRRDTPVSCAQRHARRQLASRTRPLARALAARKPPQAPEPLPGACVGLRSRSWSVRSAVGGGSGQLSGRVCGRGLARMERWVAGGAIARCRGGPSTLGMHGNARLTQGRVPDAPGFFVWCGCRMGRRSSLALQALVALVCLTVVSGQFFVNLNDKNKVLLSAPRGVPCSKTPRTGGGVARKHRTEGTAQRRRVAHVLRAAAWAFMQQDAAPDGIVRDDVLSQASHMVVVARQPAELALSLCLCRERVSRRGPWLAGPAGCLGGRICDGANRSMARSG